MKAARAVCETYIVEVLDSNGQALERTIGCALDVEPR
jgi:hypothetical protein